MIVPLSPSQEMNYNYSFLILKNLSMFVCTLFSFLKVVEKYLGRVTKLPIIYTFFFLTINQTLLKRTKLKLYNLEHLS